MKVKNFKGHNGTVKNQFIIEDDKIVIFQSYERIIAIKEFGQKIKLDKTYWDYSKTTGKYRNLFLGETKMGTEKKIKSGEYILADLN